MEEAAATAAEEEHTRKQTQLDLQDRYRLELKREQMVTTVSESDSTNMVLKLNREKSGKLRLSRHEKGRFLSSQTMRFLDCLYFVTNNVTKQAV